MRKLVCVIAVLVASSAMSVTAGTGELCSGRWPNDFELVKRCLLRQRNGLQYVSRFVKRHDRERKERGTVRTGVPDPHIQMVMRCRERWAVPRYDSRDWVMVARCLRKSEKAHNARHGTGGTKRKRGPYGEPPGDRFEDKLSPLK